MHSHGIVLMQHPAEVQHFYVTYFPNLQYSSCLSPTAMVEAYIGSWQWVFIIGNFGGKVPIRVCDSQHILPLSIIYVINNYSNWHHYYSPHI